MFLRRIKYFFAVALGFLMPAAVLAQSATSGVMVFSFDDLSDYYMPPELYVDIDFTDDNGNQILEAKESGTISIRIENKGGDAEGVKLLVQPYQEYPGFLFENVSKTLSIKENESVELSYPVSANIDIPTDSVKLNIHVQEQLGYDIDAQVVMSTFEYQKSKLQMQGVTIIDTGRGLRALNNNPDGKIQKGEVVRANVTIQNVGNGVADNVRYSVKSGDRNVLLMSESGPVDSITGNVGTMLAGEVQEISFRMSASNSYSGSDRYLPVYIDLYEDMGFGDLAAANVPIPLGESPEKIVTVDIRGNQEMLLAQQKTKVYSSSDRITSKMSVRDISIAPACTPIYSNAVAIVLGAEQNSYGVAPAPYAARDAQLMAGYFKTSLGIRDVQLRTDEQVTRAALDDMFNPDYGHLKNVVVPGQTDVFVYYSGHGMPDVSTDGTQDIFLFPYDARKERINERGYSINKLYADLNSLGAKSVTVILDACFSGSSRQTSTYTSQNISNTKGVRITNFSNRPWDTNPNFRLFTSSSADQTSLGYDQSRSGLFTYFLACGLQGDADTNGDGTIKLEELVTFVIDKVQEESRKIRGGNQTPQFYGNGDFVIEKLK